VLCNLFLADELNRATSRTQSALLEAMEEGQVTVDGNSYALPQPFVVIATQNPTGAAGTQLLPDSQMDRFTVRLSLGYPSPKDEAAMVLHRQGQDPLKSLLPLLSTEDVVAMQEEVAATYVGDTVYGYDAQHNFFSMDESFQRTILGTTGLEMGPNTEIEVDFLDIRGMAYDAANDRLLVIGAKCCLSDGWIDEYQASTVIYEVNLENGNLTELVTLSEELFTVRGMAVDGEGNVFVYTAFDDYFSLVDLTTGGFAHKCTLQSLGVYGSSEHNMPMAYDAATGLVYCLLTGNGTFHNMMTFNPMTAQVENLGEVGEVVYNEDTWMNEGPTFSALLIK
jgi:hypothetical protein